MNWLKSKTLLSSIGTVVVAVGATVAPGLTVFGHSPWLILGALGVGGIGVGVRSAVGKAIVAVGEVVASMPEPTAPPTVEKPAPRTRRARTPE